MKVQQDVLDYFVEYRVRLSNISTLYVKDVLIDNFLKKNEGEQIKYEHIRGDFCDHFIFKKEAISLFIKYIKKDGKHLYEIELRIYNKKIKTFKYKKINISDCISFKTAFEILTKKLKEEKLKMIFIK
jgi:hypothetical protein